MTESELEKYIRGINEQLEEARKKVYQLEGALMLAQQMHSTAKAEKEPENVEAISQPVQETN